MSTTIHFYVLSGGLTISIASLVRMTFLIGGLVKEFRIHVDNSRILHSDQERRLRDLERRRR